MGEVRIVRDRRGRRWRVRMMQLGDLFAVQVRRWWGWQFVTGAYHAASLADNSFRQWLDPPDWQEVEWTNKESR